MFGKKNKHKRNTRAVGGSGKNFILNENTPFSVQEAYKTIRTNLIFSLPDKGCKKVVITSSTMHEFKSTTAINLSMALADNGFKVLLLDCDLRLTMVAESLSINAAPGLSDYLVGLTDRGKVIQEISENFHVITAGTIPPNPSELLSSKQMEEFMALLEASYDFIIIDSPPVGSVVDAVLLARMANGFLFVVRNGIARRDELDKCLQKMKVSGSKMLGFIYTAAMENRGGYYYYKDYRRK